MSAPGEPNGNEPGSGPAKYRLFQAVPDVVAAVRTNARAYVTVAAISFAVIILAAIVAGLGVAMLAPFIRGNGVALITIVLGAGGRSRWQDDQGYGDLAQGLEPDSAGERGQCVGGGDSDGAVGWCLYCLVCRDHHRQQRSGAFEHPPGPGGRYLVRHGDFAVLVVFVCGLV